MPEYLAPGVYVEEVSFRSKSIEGVPTSTTGFAGMTRSGPIYFLNGPQSCEPRLITSFTEYEQVYGGLESLWIGDTGQDERLCYMGHSARAFFENGGKRLYVSRVFLPRDGDTAKGVAFKSIAAGSTTASWRARWPGAYGNVYVSAAVTRSKNLLFRDDNLGLYQARRVKRGAVVEIITSGTPPTGSAVPTPATLWRVDVDPGGKQTFHQAATTHTLAAADVVQLLEMSVTVQVDQDHARTYAELATDSNQKRYIGKILQQKDPEDENAAIWLDYDQTAAGVDPQLSLYLALINNPGRLAGGNDGLEVSPIPGAGIPPGGSLEGEEASLDDPTVKATGLAALGEIDDIAIVALPDAGALSDPDTIFAATDALISHAERLRYRIAVVDGPQGSSMSEIRHFRGRSDSKYAALYHPWIEALDPLERPAQGAPPRRLILPPSGFVCGIYARSDIERGVHKAPANEVVHGMEVFEANINKGRQDVLNPEGINALRFFEGRGNRVWGARTMSSDPEWKYVNVRRLFIYMEHSIDKGTQWAVFEPNNERLWANIRQTVEDFLLVLWKNGALLGEKPEDAYFVRCDRTTMTQNDLDNGRLICLIGVAPVKPAEYVIFRIGQWTADSKKN